MRGRAVAVLSALLVAACSGSGTSSSPATNLGSSAPAPTEEITPTTETATDPSTTAATSTGTSLDPGDIEVSDEILDYLAAVEELLVETAYEDAVTEDPDVFIATGFLLCQQLTDGDRPEDVLTSYVEALTGVDVGEAEDDDLALAGTILGTAVGYLCPEHSNVIEEAL